MTSNAQPVSALSNQSHAQVGIKAVPRTPERADFPGHVGVTWKWENHRFYRNFRFRITDLPKEFQPASKWRRYLSANHVPGVVFTGLMFREAHQHRPQELLCRQWPATAAQIAQVKLRTQPGPLGRYSFNPNPQAGVHNCFT